MTQADIIFRGGPVFTGTGVPLDGRAVAVTGSTITAIVPESEATTLIGPTTRVVELDGALLSPGFQDAHVHPIGGGLELLQCNLAPADSAAEAVATVTAYAAEHPDAEWILGGGWTMSHFPGGAPVRQLLDDAAPGRRVLLASRDHHSAWASSAAITAAGIDRTTPDPADGRIEREADGTPAGTFHEGAERLFDEARPAVSGDEAYAGLLAAQRELLALGITGWQDACVGPGVSGVDDVQAAYDRALAEGTLVAHVVGAQWWERSRGLEQIPAIVARRDAIIDTGTPDRFHLGTVKMMVDGVAENQTAAMLTPYRDAHGHDTDNSGLSFIDPAILRDAVTQLDALGFQVHFHALGDRAVREALDAVERARDTNGGSDGRHHLAHLQVVAEADAARFADLDAVANLQALWATHEEQLDELTLPFMQEGQEARQYPFGDIAGAGARLACGSDWPVSSANPLEAIQVAVTRTEPGTDGPPLGGAHQRLDLSTALAAYTSGSAYVNHREHDTGSIREGYLANLVVLDPDPFTVDESSIHRTRVTSTWVDGVAVHGA